MAIISFQRFEEGGGKAHSFTLISFELLMFTLEIKINSIWFHYIFEAEHWCQLNMYRLALLMELQEGQIDALQYWWIPLENNKTEITQTETQIQLFLRYGPSSGNVFSYSSCSTWNHQRLFIFFSDYQARYSIHGVVRFLQHPYNNLGELMNQGCFSKDDWFHGKVISIRKQRAVKTAARNEKTLIMMMKNDQTKR